MRTTITAAYYAATPGSSSALRIPYYTDIIQEAAALWESLSRNHPFVDGNKRVAVSVTATFLRVNGHRLVFIDNEAFAFLSGLYKTGSLRFKELESWLRQHATTSGQKV